jgi:hypothetical protein
MGSTLRCAKSVLPGIQSATSQPDRLATVSSSPLGSIKPLSKWSSRRSLVKASMPLRCSQRSPVASCRKSLRSAPTGSPLARRSASAACCSNADSSRVTCGPKKLIFVVWRKIDLYPTPGVRFVKSFTIHLRPGCDLSPAFRIGALGASLFPRTPITAPSDRFVSPATAWVPFLPAGSLFSVQAPPCTHLPRAWCP